MNLCESIKIAINEGVKDFIKEKFNIKDDAFEKTSPDHCVKSIARTKDGWVGFSHRAYHEFKIGDNLFDPEWNDDGKLTEEDVEKMKFVERGSKPCNNIDDCKEAATNFETKDKSVNEKKIKHGGKLNKEDAEILKDTLTKKYRKDKRIEVHFKLVKIGNGYGMEFNVMPIRIGDDDDTVLNRVEAEVTNEIKGIISKWEKDNPMNESINESYPWEKQKYQLGVNQIFHDANAKSVRESLKKVLTYTNGHGTAKAHYKLVDDFLKTIEDNGIKKGDSVRLILEK